MSSPELKEHAHPHAQSKPEAHFVVVHSFPKLIFAWPLILLGYLFLLFDDPTKFNMEIIAWIYITVLAVVVVTIGLDLGRNATIGAAIMIALLWVIGMYLRDVKQVPILSDIYNFFANIDPTYSGKFGFAVSIVLSVFFALAILKAFIDERWRITHNEIEHYSFGRKDDSLGRGAKRVVSRYSDIFELAIMGAGNLEIWSSTGRQRLAVIEHVPLLPLRMGKITRILESTSIHSDVSDEEETTAEREEDDSAQV